MDAYGTPATPQQGARCDGFILNVDASLSSPEESARRAVDSVLGPGWKLRHWVDGEYQASPTERSEPARAGVAFELARELTAQEGIEQAEPDLVQPGADPDPRQVHGSHIEESVSTGPEHEACSLEPTWALSACRVPEAWTLEPKPGGSKYGRGIVIAHPDTGYTLHPEVYSERLLADRGYDFEDDKSDPRDSLSGQAPGHGTATASVAMSAREAQGDWRPVEGVAPEAQLVPFRVSTSVVHLKFSNVARAIHKATDDGCHVISMSLGGPFGPRYLQRAVRRAVRRGVIVIAAAGNVWPWVVYPGRYPETICVAASNCNRGTWDDSASGSRVDVAAPGESVWRARATEDGTHTTARSSGTSYATAMMAGACALWLAHHGRDNLIARYGSRRHLAPVFKHLLTTSGVTTPAGWDTEDYGAGILDVEALLRAELPDAAPPPLELVEFEPDAVQAVAGFFPDMSLDEVRDRLLELTASEAAPGGADLQDVTDELCFQIATNPEFRAAVRGRREAPSLESVLQVDADLSPTLQSRLRL